MRKRIKALSFVGELGLWGAANVLCVGLALAILYGVGHVMLGWGAFKLSLLMALGAILTATWGSWATLVWTRSRGLRAVQQAMTLVPGVALVALGGAAFYFGLAGWPLALALGGAGVGLGATSVTLAGGVLTQNVQPSRLQHLLGLTLFPLMATALSGVVMFIWMSFLPSPIWSGLKGMFTLSAMMTFVMASALISTVIPALCSRACQELAQAWGITRRR